MTALERIVKAMNLTLIDEEYKRIKSLEFNGQTIDDKYKYRSQDGTHIYSEEYLLQAANN